MKLIKLENGLELEVNEANLNNMELVDALAEMEENEAIATSKAVKLAIGAENRKKLYNHLRDENGNVPIEQVMKNFEEILNKLGDNAKNL